MKKIIHLPVTKSLRISKDENERFQEIANKNFDGSFSHFVRYCAHFYETYWKEKDYNEKIQKYLDELERDKKRALEERGLRLETKKVSKTYRRKVHSNKRKTFC